MDKLKSWEGIGIVNRYMGKCKEGNFNIDRDDFREILEIFLKKENDINEEIKKTECRQYINAAQFRIYYFRTLS
ncbi:hypothetical protein [Xenorhabdus nematophila]|uniref:hypothetical protein n=1 Tax=Xenorhabdus nematophila TaxID=628 RepID=UPI0005708F7A|nr:hypothetical protein [Xenorhabdus nematophila]KHD27559.1 hypothetical protein LH67_16985 [Xenorhabdus nematophila]